MTVAKEGFPSCAVGWYEGHEPVSRILQEPTVLWLLMAWIALGHEAIKLIRQEPTVLWLLTAWIVLGHEPV